MTPSQVQAAREAFEAPFSDRMERYETGGYVNELINEQWIGYRAAWERLQKIMDDREAEIALLGTELQRQVASLTAERDRYRDTLLSRHGGECLALLDELDEARERIADLTRELEEARRDAVRLDWLDAQCSEIGGRHIGCIKGRLRLAMDANGALAGEQRETTEQPQRGDAPL